ncbi:Cytochrome b [Halopseudomonas xinjiangensis]|uniref:Cytochrome b n=1 Tax=Halopseudomonas xinjiangensis TaxID=487184 RepID=A0A1H1XZC1_9GAMM|nr:cytochrome b/b6 domain-containing protein [Halopseudomonas xinjiangensis]SDT14520.1 Cytochrome b [Halopseudomonas xinjiangensis]
MRIKVWDFPTRLFHWLLVLAVAGALLTVSLGEAWMLWHQRLGLAVVGLLGFRLVWGFCGPSAARFSSFVPTPHRLVAQWHGQWQGPGHTPVGALSVLAMLGLFGFQAVTGLFSSDDVAFSGPWAGEVSSQLSRTLSGWHRSTEEALYLLIGVHLLAIAAYQWRGKQLVGAMLHGRKPVPAAVEPPKPARPMVLVAALVTAGLAIWVASGL